MKNSSYKSDDVFTEALLKHGDMVRRICFIYLRNLADVEDAFQDVFIKLMQVEADFQNEEHLKAWLCRVTINKCKDICKSFWRKNVGPIDDVSQTFEVEEESELMQAIVTLPEKYKEIIYLFYYEDYTVVQMAKMLNQKENTIYSNLHRARQLLKKKLEGSGHEYEF